jgi:CBS domain-containing protein
LQNRSAKEARVSAGRICIRSVDLADPSESVADAARRMRERSVGTLLVLDAERRPAGILTDRDVVLRCVAEGRDPGATPVSAVMTSPVACVRESTPIEDALRRMAAVRTRRLAVVDDDGRLAGILALDDALELLTEEVEAIGRLLRARAPLLRGAP